MDHLLSEIEALMFVNGCLLNLIMLNEMLKLPPTTGVDLLSALYSVAGK